MICQPLEYMIGFENHPLSKTGSTLFSIKWEVNKHPVLGKYESFITLARSELVDLKSWPG